MVTGIMLNFIIMDLLKLPFDVVTVMFSSVAIGVGIDDSIHLIIRYRRRFIPAYLREVRAALPRSRPASGAAASRACPRWKNSSRPGFQWLVAPVSSEPASVPASPLLSLGKPCVPRPSGSPRSV